MAAGSLIDMEFTEDQIAELERKSRLIKPKTNGESEGEAYDYQEDDPEELDFD
jgi:hypothetical protein